jgi:methanogenic corrinoid protein MtbC1
MESYAEILYPLVNRMGMMWACDRLSPAHEHFISALLVQKLSVTINALPFPPVNAETWILFLPENEFHEIGLLFANYMLRQSGKRVIYLGSNLPAGALAPTVKLTHADKLLCFLVRHNAVAHNQQYLDEVKRALPKGELVICGSPANLEGLKSKNGVHFVHDWKEFEAKLGLHNNKVLAHG